MLWEPDDPAVALEERFGHRGAGEAADWLRDRLARHWGIRDVVCERVLISDRNALAWVGSPRGPLLVKWSVAPERFARLEAVARLTRWLDEQDIPVSAPLPALVGRLQVADASTSMHVQRVVEGDLLDVDDPLQVHAAGALLARLHLALAAYDDPDGVLTGTPPDPLPERIERWLLRRGEHLPARAERHLRAMLDLAPAEAMSVQLVHRDVRSANLLWSGDRIAAVLDLEETTPDHPAVDLARTAVLLGTRFRDWGPVRRDVRTDLLLGYASVRPLTSTEHAWWELLELWWSWAMVPTGPDPTGWRAAAEELVDPGGAEVRAALDPLLAPHGFAAARGGRREWIWCAPHDELLRDHPWLVASIGPAEHETDCADLVLDVDAAGRIDELHLEGLPVADDLLGRHLDDAVPDLVRAVRHLLEEP